MKETGDLNYIYKDEDASYADNEYLAKKTILDKILKDKTYEIAINLKYNGYQGELASMV